MFVRSNWNYDRDAASLRSSIVEFGETRTQQNFRDQCDINRIVKQYGATGLVPVTRSEPLPDGFYGVTDYHTSLNMIQAADAAFMALAPDLRARFRNDPGEFVDFVTDPANLDECISLGLANAKPVSVPVTVQAEGLETSKPT